MEAQDPGWAADVGQGKSFGTHKSPPWAWLTIIALIGLIFWHFVPVTEVHVSYAPWFLEQVESDNIQSLTITGVEAHGILRQVRNYPKSTSRVSVPVRKFITDFASDGSIEPIVRKLTSPRRLGSPSVEIQADPPVSRLGLWFRLLISLFVILGLVYSMRRGVRDRVDRSRRGLSP
jgi:cell division protease FtsH